MAGNTSDHPFGLSLALMVSLLLWAGLIALAVLASYGLAQVTAG